MQFTRAVYLVLSALFMCNAALAGGFRVFSQSTASLSQGDATVAHYDNAMSMFYNPSTMVDADQSQFLYDHLIFRTYSKFKAAGRSDDTETGDYHVPHFSYLHKLDEESAIGLSLAFPFGLGQDWGKTWPGRYQATEAELRTYNLTANYARRLTPHLSLGAGLSYMYSEVELKRKINASLLLGGAPAGDIASTMNADGDGWGYNLGILYKLSDNVQLGANYRSEINVDYAGKSSFSIPASALALAPFFPNQQISTFIDFPAVAAIGINVRLSRKLNFEVDADWTGWSSFDSLLVKNRDGSRVEERKDYQDSWTLHFGGRYAYSDSLLFRFGYFFDQTPVPKKYMDPLLPCADKQAITFGFKYRYSNMAFSAGYEYVKYQQRSSSLSALPGRYKSQIHIAGFSWEYNF